MLTILFTFFVWAVFFLFVVFLRLKLNLSLLIIGALLYIIPAFYLPVISDVGLFETVGIKILERTDFYVFDGINHGTYPFLPFMLWYYVIAHLLASATGLKFVVFVRMLMILAVFACTLMMGKLLPKSEKSSRIQALFLLNPINLLVVSLHGQTDLFLIFFVLLSIWLNKKKHLEFFSGIAMGLSILTKTWSIIFVPLFLLGLKNISGIFKWIIGVVFAILMFIAFYSRLLHSNTLLIFDSLRHAGGPTGQWGLSGIATLFTFISANLTNAIIYAEKQSLLIICFGLLVGYIGNLIRKNTLLVSIVVLLLIFMFITPRWGIQYISWVLPFAAAAGFEKNMRSYSLLSLPYLSLSYMSIIYENKQTHFALLNEIAIILGIVVWVYVIFWLKQILTSNNINKKSGQ